jgi:hypothetical protein
VSAKRYTLTYRPPSTFCLPRVAWTLVERPRVPGFEGRTDLPESAHQFGVVTFARELTADEILSYELEEVR